MEKVYEFGFHKELFFTIEYNEKTNRFVKTSCKISENHIAMMLLEKIQEANNYIRTGVDPSSIIFEHHFKSPYSVSYGINGNHYPENHYKLYQLKVSIKTVIPKSIIQIMDDTILIIDNDQKHVIPITNDILEHVKAIREKVKIV